MSILDLKTPPAQTIKPEDLELKFKVVKPKTPFGDMALALSGGGFRAAAFSLGAISYLNSAWYADETDTLLRHVTFITSTSGGSLTNAVYSTGIFKPGFVFANFYAGMRNFLTGDEVVKNVFEILADPDRWDEVGKLHGEKVEKSHNLINAFAKAYDTLIFKGETLDVFFNRAAKPHLQTVCFNSTELNNGIAFRFQTNGDPASVFTIGNYYLHFTDAGIARKLKISDIAATSSCFPIGFEPMVYPYDYTHPGIPDVKQMVDAVTYENNDPTVSVKDKPFCMADGGVVDNQGLDSIMMEDNYRAKNPPKKQFDLMMICDVCSYFNTAFETPGETTSFFKNFTLTVLKSFLWCGLVLAVLGIAMLLCCTTQKLGLTLLIFTLIPSLIFAYVLTRVHMGEKPLSEDIWGRVLLRYGKYFLGVKLANLQQMISGRLKELVTLNMNTFLNQERRQYYSEFYTMPAYKNRVLSCLIYEFSKQHTQMREDNLKITDGAWWPSASGDLSPSQPMQAIASSATNMATTLWFDKGAQTIRDEIIACGQFTMCYNLLKHIYRLEVLDEKWKADKTLQALKARLITDWDKFLKDPMFMV
jgi:hypothetical protein